MSEPPRLDKNAGASRSFRALAPDAFITDPSRLEHAMLDPLDKHTRGTPLDHGWRTQRPITLFL